MVFHAKLSYHTHLSVCPSWITFFAFSVSISAALYLCIIVSTVLLPRIAQSVLGTFLIRKGWFLVSSISSIDIVNVS